MNETDVMPPRMSRAAQGRPAAPARILHLGLGNFTRAHQAYCTEHAADAADWGIVAFTGRAGDVAVPDALAAQDGVYTLIVAEPQGDRFETISSIVAIRPADDLPAMRGYFADPAIVIVTSTVTEAGYMRDRHGDLDMADPAVRADLDALRACPRADTLTTIPAKVAAGLLARRASGAGPITILPCDNLAGNGEAFRRVVEQAIRAVDPTLLDWTRDNVAWATSMVDRITPRTTDEDRRVVAEALGWRDEAPVRTEPFLEWVIEGRFPQGRPAWEHAGAVFADDVEPYEQRKLWLLNGAHSTMAYIGPLLGLATVAEAIGDPRLGGWVRQWWDLAAGYLSIDSDGYRAQLLERFSNPRMRDALLRIAADGSLKLPVRIVPVARRARAEGRDATPAARVIAAWILFLRRFGDTQAQDADLDAVRSLAAGADADAVRAATTYLDATLGADEGFLAAVRGQLDELAALAVPATPHADSATVCGAGESDDPADPADSADPAESDESDESTESVR